MGLFTGLQTDTSNCFFKTGSYAGGLQKQKQNATFMIKLSYKIHSQN